MTKPSEEEQKTWWDWFNGEWDKKAEAQDIFGVVHSGQPTKPGLGAKRPASLRRSF